MALTHVRSRVSWNPSVTRPFRLGPPLRRPRFYLGSSGPLLTAPGFALGPVLRVPFARTQVSPWALVPFPPRFEPRITLGHVPSAVRLSIHSGCVCCVPRATPLVSVQRIDLCAFEQNSYALYHSYELLVRVLCFNPTLKAWVHHGQTCPPGRLFRLKQ